MQQEELFLGLLVAVAVLVSIARRINVPYPILLVLGGLIFGFIPGLPSIKLNPDIVLLLFLPPLLYWESLSVSLRDLRANVGQISSLAIGLVLATAASVGWIAHTLIPGFSWPAAFVLGAVIAPTDEVAVVPVIERLGVPRRLEAIIEGESLINDGISLVLYRLAITAVATGFFSFWYAGLQFVVASLGGIVIGLIVGWLIGQLRRRIYDPPVENTVSLLTGFVSYFPAEALGVSGVLAVLATGLYLGRQGPRFIAPTTRLQAQAFWGMLTFILNGILFLLVGLELREVLSALSNVPLRLLIFYGASVTLAAVLVRLLWVFPGAYLPRALSARLRRHNPSLPWQHVTLLGWTGIRGGISLAAALAIPLTTSDGSPFPQRAMIIFLTFSVIFATLILQGLSLPLVIRWLGIGADDDEQKEENTARMMAAQAGIARLDALVAEGWVPDELAEDVREHYVNRRARYVARLNKKGDGRHEKFAKLARRLNRELVKAERHEIIRLRDEGVINDEVLRRVQHDLDLSSARLGPGSELHT